MNDSPVPDPAVSLLDVFRGWDGYNRSLRTAFEPLTDESLRYRAATDGRSVGELGAHIAFGRLDWFHRMGAAGTAELVEAAAPWWKPWSPANPAAGEDKAVILHWLDATWNMIEANLKAWTVADLFWSYQQPYGGKVYAVSRQWVIYRILSHDIQHGGQLTILLAEQGIFPDDLTGNGGHIIEVPEVGGT